MEDDYEIFKGNVEPIFDQTSYDEAVDEYVNKHSEQYTKYIEDAWRMYMKISIWLKKMLNH